MASEAWTALSALGLGVCAAALLGRLLPKGRRRGPGGLIVPLCVGLSLAIAALTAGAWFQGPASFLSSTVAWTAGIAFLLATAAFLWKLAVGFPLLVLFSLAALSLGWLRWGWIPLADAGRTDAAAKGWRREAAAPRPSKNPPPPALLRLSLLPEGESAWSIRVERPGPGTAWEAAGEVAAPGLDASVVLYTMSFSEAWRVAGPLEWAWAAGLAVEGGKALDLPSRQTDSGSALSWLRLWLIGAEKASLRLPGLAVERLVLPPRALRPGRAVTLSWDGEARWSD